MSKDKGSKSTKKAPAKTLKEKRKDKSDKKKDKKDQQNYNTIAKGTLLSNSLKSF